MNKNAMFFLLCMLFAYPHHSMAQDLNDYKYFIIDQAASGNVGPEKWEISALVTKTFIEKGFQPVNQKEIEQWNDSAKALVLYLDILYSKIAYATYNVAISCTNSLGKFIVVHQGEYRGYRSDGYISAAKRAMSDLKAYSLKDLTPLHKDQTFTIQPKVGLNVANGTGATPDNVEKNVRLGLVAGIEFEYQFTKLFSLALGALYSQQGAKAKTTVLSEKLTETDKLDYINFPIVANFYVAKGFALKFGCQPAFRVNNSYEISAEGRSFSGKMTDLGFKINTFDLSIPIGLSYEYNNAVIDVRYNIGITKLAKDDNAKNSVFQFTLGYKFKLH